MIAVGRVVGRVAESVAVSTSRLSRRLRLGGGTSIGGAVLNRLAPSGMERLAADIQQGCVLISGTNGKTTTARMLRACLQADGRRVTANAAGANLASGVSAALLEASRAKSSGVAELGVFEVDEAALDEVIMRLRPRLVLLMNLFRDQLDRYGELEVIAERWKNLIDSLPDDTTLLLNADDPALAHLGGGRPSTFFYGLGNSDEPDRQLSHAADTLRCRGCGERLSHDFVTVGHMGGWRCESCGLMRPEPHFLGVDMQLRGFEGLSFSVRTPTPPRRPRETARPALGAQTKPASTAAQAAHTPHPAHRTQEQAPHRAHSAKEPEEDSVDIRASLPLGGLHNVYNALAAASASVLLETTEEAIRSGLADVDPAFGRAEQITLEGRDVRLLLAKNPTGANENVRFVLTDEGPLHLLILLNDRTADGTDPSWIWDVDYEPLLGRLKSLTLGGRRCWELALRFRYGGAPTESFSVRESLPDALETAIASTPEGGILWVLPTYTAMLELRTELVRRGAARAFWETA